MTQEETRGRNTVMTPEIINKLELAYAMDMTDLEACVFAGIGKTAFYDWQKLNPEFTERKEELRAALGTKAKANVAREVRKGNIEMSRWWLERRRKSEFSTRQEQTGPNGGPQAHVIEVPKPIIIKVHSVANKGDADGSERTEHSGTVPPVI